MSIFKKIDKVLAGLGNIRAMERNHVDTFTEEKIQNIKGKKIAESNFGQLYITFQNLTGYEFLNAIVLSGSNIKTFKGCDLVLEQQGQQTIIPSDTKDIESDYSNVSNRYMTKLSFIINTSQKKMITNGQFDTIYINYKKKSLPLSKV